MQRKNAPSNADVWDLRIHWERECSFLYSQVIYGKWRMSPMLVTRSGQVMWSSRDALILKWVAIKLKSFIPVHDDCLHAKGRGGVKKSIDDLKDKILNENYNFILRTDIKGCYHHIVKSHVLWQIKQYIQNYIFLELISQYVWYSVEWGGLENQKRASQEDAL